MENFISIFIFFSVLQSMLLNGKSYDLKCHLNVSWKIRAKIKCNSTLKYYCLYNNVEGKYVEGCTGPDWDRKGSKRIFSGSFTRENCIQKRFQPFTFWTNGSLSDCVFAKSKCSGEGQLVYKDESANKDRTCRCDYKRGYVFINKPRNVCYCIPTKEDCSCHLKSCPVNFKLSADYSCTLIGIQEKSKCVDITETNETVAENTKVFRLSKTISTLSSYSSPVAVFIICLIVVVAVGFFIAVLCPKRKIKTVLPLKRYFQLNRTGELTTKEVFFLRMIHLLYRVTCPAVRMAFDNEIQPNQLQKWLNENKSQMIKRYRTKERVINDFQWDLLYKKDQVTSDDFDISLMIHILNTRRHINDCNVYPVSTDTSVSAMLTRIQYIRNETNKQIKGELSEDTFYRYWNVIGQAVLKLVSSLKLQIDDEKEKNQLLGRFLALNPINITIKNIRNFIYLSERKPAIILQQLLVEYCFKYKDTIGNILTREKHALYHKRCSTKACCTCITRVSSYSKVISENQWEALYEVSDDSCSHLCRSKIKDCCERYVPKEINILSCDVLFLKTLILNIPHILNYVVRNWDVRLGNFLKQNAHKICHYMKGKRCCKCDKFFSEKTVIDSSQLEKLFIKTNISCPTGIMNCCCQYTVKRGVKYTDIDDIVLSKILDVTGPFSVLKRIQDNPFLYFLTWTVNKVPLSKALKKLQKGIQDKRLYRSVSYYYRSQSNETTANARRWITRNLDKQKETMGQQLHIMVIDEDVLNVKTVQKPEDFAFPRRTKRFTDITTEENYFLIVLYGLSKVVYPLLKREFNRNCPDEALDKIRMTIIYEQQTQDDENKSQKKRMYLTLNQQQQRFSPKGEKSENLDLELMIYVLKEISSEKGKKEYVDQLYVIDAIRREIVHSSSGVLTETRFQEVFKCIRKAVLCLGGHLYEKKLSELQDIRNILK